MTLREPRRGEILKIKQRPVAYTRHPVVRGERRYGLQTRLFATNPWSVIRGSVNEISDSSTKNQARAFIEQAEDFYRAFQSAHETASKPLLVYYAMLNLAKAFALKKGTKTKYDRAKHGLQEGVHPQGVEFDNSFLKAFKSKLSSVNIFDDFLHALCNGNLGTAEKVYDLKHIHAQILQGHRLWASAYNNIERFIEIARVDFIHSQTDKNIWLVINVFADDLTRFNISRKTLIEQSGLKNYFANVKSNEIVDGRLLLKFEQITPLSYSGRPSDKIEELVAAIRNNIWSAVLKMPPYRKNYLYLSPPSEVPHRLPQLASVYAFIYYLGSVTRYRPYYLETILSKPYGAHIEEVISNVPQQFLFLLASEFAAREVAHAPIV